jgi:hypothetical protein
MRKGRHLILALIGAALFTWVVARVGLPAVLQQLNAMRLACQFCSSLACAAFCCRRLLGRRP